MPEVWKLKGKEAAGSYLFMYLVLKLPRQEFLSRWAMVLINFSSRTSVVLQIKKQVFFKETLIQSCVRNDWYQQVKALSIDIEIQIKILVMYFYSHLFSLTGDYLFILMYLLPTLCKRTVKLSPLTDKVQSSGHFFFPCLYEFFFHHRSMLI